MSLSLPMSSVQAAALDAALASAPQPGDVISEAVRKAHLGPTWKALRAKSLIDEAGCVTTLARVVVGLRGHLRLALENGLFVIDQARESFKTDVEVDEVKLMATVAGEFERLLHEGLSERGEAVAKASRGAETAP